ncbi:MAG: hypothetical protein LC799_34685, partial [Actinobacteria bacterium]|nr:hypothetical protein [Actinomycetota bacterium]
MGGDKTEVMTDIEAWYNTSPLPGGELPVVPPPANPYDEHTLHVRITSGEEDARTYVSLDTTDLPAGAEINAGTLILPLHPTETDTGDDRKALFEACLADPIIDRVSGSFEAPPEVDCKLKSGAIYEGKPEPHFVVDLTPFVDFLETNSLALLPTDSAREQADTWHVAFYDKKNESKDAAPIVAE